MFELLFLGTSASAPSVHRGLSAQLVIAREHRFLVDCGEGTQRQILRSRVGFKRLNRILITHGHLDHILGLAGLLSTLVRWESLDALEIYGSRWALERVQDLIYRVVFRNERLPIPIQLIEVQEGVFFETRDFTVSAFPVTHRGAGCFGYIFQEKTRRPFLPEKADALGVPFGPERAKLVRGEPITLSDGRVVQPDDVLGAEVRGARYVHTGDVGRTDNIVEYVRDAHALVTEATYLSADADLAQQFGHMTAAAAARLAAEAGVQTLILTHLSRRSRERDVLAEAQAIFPNTYVARDFDRFSINKERGVTKIVPEPTESHAAPEALEEDEPLEL
ncbi:MAG: ribonuclease [Candidatus Thermofonsia Clade 1 bacterium]|uniref:Ribonuclease Z n=1 Tax=Candidatus Thermofonsia Clade 1 bacterium TaxID=2364210 RepID=A0A2M8NZS1_9CHLR|nr:MAG: ribonuclease [Candidatus Thermofonsia Clade 1 bacterium]